MGDGCDGKKTNLGPISDFLSMKTGAIESLNLMTTSQCCNYGREQEWEEKEARQQGRERERERER